MVTRGTAQTIVATLLVSKTNTRTGSSTAPPIVATLLAVKINKRAGSNTAPTITAWLLVATTNARTTASKAAGCDNQQENGKQYCTNHCYEPYTGEPEPEPKVACITKDTMNGKGRRGQKRESAAQEADEPEPELEPELEAEVARVIKEPKPWRAPVARMF
ncbi:hypothetical protein DL95DRAFT_470588 [Leptodontidium sp. 2 PMI_412]|nr:hypothetical protein DL95DRAFT_470588 [Leptodontidium sp. 2 PMI_412]